MPDPLFILSGPRSFSSVVSTMIGEHPDLYGFPELHLFVGITYQQVISRENSKRTDSRYAGPPGVLRTIAQLHDGMQTQGSIARAASWLIERKDWSTKQLLDYLLDKISPKIGVEKSPLTSNRPEFIERMYAFYPNAYYLHLTRHPITFQKSLKDFSVNISKKSGKKGLRGQNSALLSWYKTQNIILQFTNTLPVGQTMRIKGEDVLSEPDVYLPQIAKWLGIRTDKDAIEAMKHPENSPYAFMGPPGAKGGNDPKFLRSPALRAGRVKEPSLTAYLEQNDVAWFSDEFKQMTEDIGLGVVSDQEIKDEYLKLANAMGYQ